MEFALRTGQIQRQKPLVQICLVFQESVKLVDSFFIFNLIGDVSSLLIIFPHILKTLNDLNMEYKNRTRYFAKF